MNQKKEIRNLDFRPALRADSDMLLQWRNDPETVAMSRMRQPVERLEHEAWLSHVLEGDQRILLIATRGEEPVGTVRFDKLANDEFEISITIRPQNRGKGFGSAMLHKASVYALKDLGARLLIAVVREDNESSRYLFEQAGFSYCATVAGMREYKLST